MIILNIYKDGDIARQYEAGGQRAEQIAKDQFLHACAAHAAQRERSAYALIYQKERYMENVKTAKEYIRNGDIFQVVLSQRFEVENPPDPFDVYRKGAREPVALPVLFR